MQLRSQPHFDGVFRANSEPPRTTSPVLKQLFADMEELSVSHRSLAQIMGVTHVSISRWRHGVTSPHLRDAEAFAQALGYRLVLEKIVA